MSFVFVCPRGKQPFDLAAGKALGELGDKRAVPPLLALLKDENTDVRRTAIEVLANIRGDEIDKKLPSRDLDSFGP